MSFLNVRALHAAYGSRQVIRDLSFQLQEGMLCGILGPNGCGKTTLIRSVCNLIPHKGRCLLDGQALEDMNSREIARVCSYIPQRSGIAVDLTVLDVVLMGFNPHLGLLQYPDKAMRSRAMNALCGVGLEHRAQDSYLSLSEGQKQLCILARTLVSDGKLLLMDEPESALDFQRRYDMLQDIRNWIARGRRCALMALHDPQLALNLCDQLLLMRDGQICSVIHPGEDDPAKIQAALRKIYGPISLHVCRNNAGNSRLVMIKEDEYLP